MVLPTVLKLDGFPKHLTALVALGLLFVAIPFLPYSVTAWADNVVVRLVLLAGASYALWLNPIVGLVAFMCVALFVIQRNKSKVDWLREQTLIAKPTDEAIVNIQTPETAPPMPEYEVPSTEVFQYEPEKDSGSNDFAPVAPSIDEKFIPDTAISNSSAKAMAQLYGNVDGTVKLMEENSNS